MMRSLCTTQEWSVLAATREEPQQQQKPSTAKNKSINLIKLKKKLDTDVTVGTGWEGEEVTRQAKSFPFSAIYPLSTPRQLSQPVPCSQARKQQGLRDASVLSNDLTPLKTSDTSWQAEHKHRPPGGGERWEHLLPAVA